MSVTEGHGGKAVDRASVARQLSEGLSRRGTRQGRHRGDAR
ncbi:MAG: hypothetical protein ACLSDQ_12480 [Adlercreutzia equolifaciens]